MDVVESIRIITSRIPAIELEYSVHGLTKTVAFSLMSDFQTQEALIAIKRLKKIGRQRLKEQRKKQEDLYARKTSKMIPKSPNNVTGASKD